MFHLRIKELLLEKSRREKRRVTLTELADFCGVSYQSVGNWSSPRGVGSISADVVANLLEFFGLRPDEMSKLLEIDMEDTQEIKPIKPDNGEPASV